MIAHLVYSIVEGFLTGLCAGAGLTWFYNRYLAGLRESYAKKAMSLLTLPVAVFGGISHAVAVYIDIPHTKIFAAAGVVILICSILSALRRRGLNASTRFEDLTGNRDGINYPRYPLPIRLGLRLLRPFNGVDCVQLVRRDVRLKGLHPDLEGLRIAFLTDFHVHPTLTLRYYKRVVGRTLALEPDVVLVGGDFVSRRWHAANARRCLKALAGHPRVIAVRGNHDFWTRPAWFARMLSDWGAELLTNRATEIRRGEGRLQIVGLEDPYVPLTRRAMGELREALDADGAIPRIGLVHTPEAFALAAELGCSFCVAGHTHGGQIRLPLFGTTIASSTLAEQFTWGAGRWGRMETLVSNGIGAFFPVRILCPPQVVLLTLRSK